MKQETYECKKCGKKIKVTDGELPSCCDTQMEKIPIDICTQPSHAEHTRPMDDEDVCDDGRAG